MRSGESEIFNFMVYPSEEARMFTSNDGISLDSCIYKIEKRFGEFCFNIKFKDEKGNIKSWNCIMGNKSFQDFAQSMQGQKLSLDDMFKVLSKFLDINIEEQKQALCNKLKIKEVIEVKATKKEDYYYAMLNK